MSASFTATWDHSPQHGTKMTLEPRCDVQRVESSRCVFFPWHLWPRIGAKCRPRPWKELLGTFGEDHGLWLVFFSMFCGCCNDWKADVWPFFSRKKKVSCTRRICGSPFMIHVGEGWLWPHVTSLYRSKKQLQLATAGKMRCRWLASQRKFWRLSLGNVSSKF